MDEQANTNGAEPTGRDAPRPGQAQQNAETADRQHPQAVGLALRPGQVRNLAMALIAIPIPVILVFAFWPQPSPPDFDGGGGFPTPMPTSQSSQSTEPETYVDTYTTAPPARYTTEFSPPPLPARPDDTVQAYYKAINEADFQTAWYLGGKNLSSDFQTFTDSFTGLDREYVTIDSVQGDTVIAHLYDTKVDGTSHDYTGTYTVSDGVIVSADLQQTN